MSLETIAQKLLGATEASRTTIRFDVPDDPYLPVFAEAVVPGVRAICDVRLEEVRQAPTFKYVDETHEVLVQGDMPTESLQGCAYLTDDFLVTAQMLAPILDGERLIGLISVHFIEGQREWTDEHVQALRDACEASRALAPELAPAA